MLNNKSSLYLLRLLRCNSNIRRLATNREHKRHDLIMCTCHFSRVDRLTHLPEYHHYPLCLTVTVATGLGVPSVETNLVLISEFDAQSGKQSYRPAVAAQPKPEPKVTLTRYRAADANLVPAEPIRRLRNLKALLLKDLGYHFLRGRRHWGKTSSSKT